MTSVVTTSIVDICTGGVGLERCLRVRVEETSEADGALELEGTGHVWEELETEGVVEIEGALEVDDVAELWMLLETTDVFEVNVTLVVEGTVDVVCELGAEEVWEFDDTVDCMLEDEGFAELVAGVVVDKVDDTTDEELEPETRLYP